jgi:hypothetical protein
MAKPTPAARMAMKPAHKSLDRLMFPCSLILLLLVVILFPKNCAVYRIPHKYQGR